MAKTKKKPTKARSQAAKKREAIRVEQENKKRIYDEIAAILLLAFGIFFAISMHTHLAGAFGEIISSAIKGLFGLGGYILPYIIVLYSAMIFAKMNRPFKAKKLIYLFLIFLMIVILNSERFLDCFSFNDGMMSIYESGVELENGGIVGMFLSYYIHKALGSTGLYLISVTVIIICLILTINTPISKAYYTAKIKKEERKKNREEKEKIALDKPTNNKGSKKEEQFELTDGYIKNYLDTSENDDPYAKKDNFKTRSNKKSIINLLKNDEQFGIKSDDGSDIVEVQKQEEIPEIKSAVTDEGFVTKDKEKIAALKKEKAEEEMFFKQASNDGNSNYFLPPINLLNPPKRKRANKGGEKELLESAKLLEKTLKSFNVEAKVINVTKGSSVTRYEIQPAIGVKVASIVRLADDIALNLRAKSIRLEAPIPGKAAVGIEVENESREMVTIGEIIDSKEFKQDPSKLAFAVGRDIGGVPVIANLAKMPHLLIAGATGSGKSVCINTIIASILYRAKPDEVKLLLIDPKMVELGNYNGIPHLLIPVVTDSAKAASALNWAVAEMTDRYKKFAANGVRDIKSYNALMKKEGKEDEVLPLIVIIIDELADLMMVASSQVEDAICRLAQLARAAGMHLIVATQRPSVDVVTGLIKANIPSRIAFMVSSQVDSRTIIDMPGAEKLVGNGDMLYKPQDLDKPLRVQGPFISDDEVKNIIEYVKSQGEEANYSDEVINKVEKGNINSGNDKEDDLMDDAILTVVSAQQASISMLQRRFRIGFNRAARIIEDMESRGIIGPSDGGKRSVLITEEEWLEMNKKTEES